MVNLIERNTTSVKCILHRIKYMYIDFLLNFVKKFINRNKKVHVVLTPCTVYVCCSNFAQVTRVVVFPFFSKPYQSVYLLKSCQSAIVH